MAMIRLVQAGQGARRPLVVLYHAGPWSDQLVTAAAGPDACVVNDTEEPSHGLYARVDAGGIENLDTVLAQAQGLAGESFTPSPLIVAGFSEGCEGVRAQLLAGHDPDVVICTDGIQVQRSYGDADLQVWRDLVARARAGRSRFLVSHAFFSATKGLPVVETMRLITGLPLPQGGTSESPLTVRDGGLTVLSADTDHTTQGHVLLPAMIYEAVTGSTSSLVKWIALAAGTLLGWILTEVAFGDRP